MIILVTGLLRYDSGKTCWTLEIISLLKEYGFSVTPFKPVGGHNAWYQYNTLKNSIELGKLVGEDAYLLSNAVGLIDMIELISPVDVLLAPLDPIGYEGDYRRYVDESTLLEKQAVVARITIPKNDRYITTHYLIEDNYPRIIRSLRSDIDVFLNRIKVYLRIKSDELIKTLESPYLIRSLAYIQEALERRGDALVIESFNNTALPVPSAAKADYVFVVSPGKIILYRGSEYRKALSIYGTIQGILAYETAPIISLLKTPMAVFDWEPRLVDKHGEIKPSVAAEKAVSMILKELNY